jgi:predicted membrane protein (TIGR00267 family)
MEEKHADRITDITIGLSDGLTIPFILVAGLTGAAVSPNIIIGAGFTVAVAGAIAMGLGAWFVSKDDETEHHHHHDETLSQMDLQKDEQLLVKEEMTKEKEEWAVFVKEHQLRLEKPNPAHARHSALTIGIAYVFGGLIPIAPYFFSHDTLEGLKWSATVTIIALFVFGFFKARFTGRNPLGGAVQLTAIGTLAASAAFFIAKLVV